MHEKKVSFLDKFDLSCGRIEKRKEEESVFPSSPPAVWVCVWGDGRKDVSTRLYWQAFTCCLTHRQEVTVTWLRYRHLVRLHRGPLMFAARTNTDRVIHIHTHTEKGSQEEDKARERKCLEFWRSWLSRGIKCLIGDSWNFLFLLFFFSHESWVSRILQLDFHLTWASVEQLSAPRSVELLSVPSHSRPISLNCHSQ